MSKFLACCLLMPGLLPFVASAAGPIGPITRITITANSMGPESEGCASYVLTAAQVRAFFDKAILISGSQQHDFFLHGPCSAQAPQRLATIRGSGKSAAWEPRRSPQPMATCSSLATRTRSPRLEMKGPDPDNSSKPNPFRSPNTIRANSVVRLHKGIPR